MKKSTLLAVGNVFGGKAAGHLMGIVLLLGGIFGTRSGWAQQAPTFVDDGITLSEKTTSNTGNAVTVGYYGVRNSSNAPYSTYTRLGRSNSSTPATPDLGTYDYQTGTLRLTSGATVVRPGTDAQNNPNTISNARVNYRVYKQGTTPPTTYSSAALTTTSAYPAAAADATQYSATTSANLLQGLTEGGTYVLEVNFQVDASGLDGDGDPTSTTYQDLSAGNYRATFTLNAPAAPTITATVVYIAPNGGANTVYNVTPSTPNPFQGANLGASYDVNTGVLTLNGGSATTTEAGPTTINNVTLYYRVRMSGMGGGAFNFVNLPQTSNNNSGTRTFGTSTANINLVSTLSTPGNYALDVYFQANGTNNADPQNPAAVTIYDNNNNNAAGAYYTATFGVTGTAIQTTTWTGGVSDDWFTADNWTNGVPNSGINAVVANLGQGNTRPYPNIYSDTTYVYNGTSINNLGKVAEARNLTLAGNSQADRSILRIISGRLKVYGNFSNIYDSFIARSRTTVEFAGGAQTITNGTFYGVAISGGSIKTLTGIMTVGREIIFNSGLLVTNISRPTESGVVLSDRSPINNNQGAQLVDETDASYLRGFVRTTRATTTLGDDYTYGAIGMELVWGGPNNPGSVDVTRNTSETYNPSSSTSSIRRIFGVRPTNPATNSGGLLANMTVRYLDSETKNLGPNGSVNINENSLVLFLSTNGGNTFTNLGRTTIDPNTNTLTRDGVTSFATFTLGDNNNPLPVKLVAFNAKRQADNALVTWATADETNNAGFEVQVSADGRSFRKLTFMPSASVNSRFYQSYSYIDVEAGKQGTRYYRLRQVDVDGKESFSSVRAVSFGAAATDLTAQVYPNPVADGEQATLLVQAPAAGTGHVQVLDMTGRQVADYDIATVSGSNELAMNANSLSAGLYLVKVTLPGAAPQTLRMQKK